LAKSCGCSIITVNFPFAPAHAVNRNPFAQVAGFLWPPEKHSCPAVLAIISICGDILLICDIILIKIFDYSNNYVK
jgi:hypothetical protein